MSNSLLTDSVIVKESLMTLKNNLVFTRGANREYSDMFAQKGAKKGDTINVRKPNRYEVTEGATMVIQDTQNESIPLQLDKHYHVGLAFTAKDRTLSLDKFREQVIDPAMETLANHIDYNFYSDMYKATFSSVGVPSASAFANTLKPFTFAKAKSELLGGPKGTYNAVVDPLTQATLVDGLKGLFHSSEKISQQYESGLMGIAGGCKFASSANVAKHTAGAPAGAPAIDTTVAANGVATLHLDGITGSISGCYKQGDVITIQNVYAVNPQTKQSTGELAQFVVTADTDSDSNEIASLPISPAIYLTGPKQNVNRAPTDGDLVYLFGAALTYASVVAPQSLVYHKNAYTFGSADFEIPDGIGGVKASRAVDKESGVSLTLTSGFDMVNYRELHRIDFLGGWKCIYPELGCRVVGALS